MTPLSQQRTAAFARRPLPQTPPQTRVYAIGDVHGRLDLLEALLAQIRDDARDFPQRKVLVLLGDLIDRGDSSRGVLECVSQLLDGTVLPGFEVHVLKGNHEAMMLAFLAGHERSDLWIDNGGDAAIASYGLNPLDPPETLRPALLDALPKHHRALLRGLELHHTEGDFVFVHAGIRPGVAWADQREGDLLWIREDFTASDADFGRVVVHGHTPRYAPEIRRNRIGIDTRAWHSGLLTCLVLEGDGRRFLHT